MAAPNTRTLWPVVFAVLAVCTWRGPVVAEEIRGPVGIVNDADADPRAQEVVQRLRSELQAAHMAWVPISQAQDLAQTFGGPPWALVFVVASEGGVAVDIALPARGASGTTARRLIPVGVLSSLTPTELALRTVEVLRAHEAAGPVERFNEPRTPAPIVVPLPAPPAKWHIDVGTSAMRGRSGLGWGVGPAVKAAWVGSGRWAARLGMASSLWGGNATGADVSAEVLQLVPTAEAMWFARSSEANVLPYVLVGGGGFFLRARTPGDERLLAHAASKWAAVAIAGVGVSVALGTETLRLLAEATCAVTAPALAVHVAGPPAGRAGQPTALVTVAVSWTL